LGADEYFVTITDRWGCKGFDSITVTEPDLLELDISSVNIKCKGDLTGRAGVVIVGGTAPYYPIWQNGDQAFSSNTLPAGKIWVTVTDHNGCVDSISTIITEPETELSINLDIEQITCFGAMDASINSYASGGTPPYFFNWNLHGLVLTDPTIRFLDKGNYYLTITDNNNCFADTTIILFEPGLLGSTFITSNPSCDGNYDGHIMMASYGGTLPYSYFIYDNIATPYLIDSLYEGEYFVMVRDSNNCEHTTGPIALIDNDVDCIHFPVAFSPNGDGYNDEWFIENIHLYPKSVVQIYNRWGQLLYEEKGIDGYWDGTFNGNPVPTGVYIYLLILNNDEKTRTGTLTLVR
jgi:gliding motility-associated-like protein